MPGLALQMEERAKTQAQASGMENDGHPTEAQQQAANWYEATVATPENPV